MNIELQTDNVEDMQKGYKGLLDVENGKESTVYEKKLKNLQNHLSATITEKNNQWGLPLMCQQKTKKYKEN